MLSTVSDAAQREYTRATIAGLNPVGAGEEEVAFGIARNLASIRYLRVVRVMDNHSHSTLASLNRMEKCRSGIVRLLTKTLTSLQRTRQSRGQ